MKKLVLPLALLAMAAIITAAMAFDCVRLAADARRRVELADDEMRTHEERLVKLLSGFSQLSPEVQAAIVSHQEAHSRSARHDAYEELVIRFRQTMSDKVDPTNPLERPFMDDVAGAINRREIAQDQFAAELTAYQRFLKSWRGAVARLFSATAREDGAS